MRVSKIERITVFSVIAILAAFTVFGLWLDLAGLRVWAYMLVSTRMVTKPGCPLSAGAA